MSTGPAIFWFRRDLRLGDQPALWEAADGGRPVVGLFVIDPALYEPAGDARRAFLLHSLADLRDRVGRALVIRHGDPVSAVAELAGQIEAEEVVATADFGPYGSTRDRQVERALADQGRTIRYVDSNYAVEPFSIRTGSGSHYKVFTPFYRSWLEHGWDPPLPPSEIAWCDGPSSEEPPAAPDTGYDLPPVGETAALQRLDEFIDGAASRYSERRDVPGVDGTSRLSPYLKWGAIHPRQILDRLGRDPSHEVFRSEIAWREFYADVLANRPETARHAFQPRMATMRLDTGAEADRRFDAWAQGRTGYPIVDAGMRQLLATGWMHNRVRMITASFLVKDLHLDWTTGARWFMRHLVDGDLASNQHGWQWVAGTGTDASPFFRIFNPTTQGKKFDPEGAYIRTWIPEISHLADRHLHEPWLDPHGPPAGYPGPVVDHGTERRESLARYEALKKSWV